MLTKFSETPARERIIVALDCDYDTAMDLADRLSGEAVWMKVGMTLYYAEGLKVVSALKEKGFRVFLDLKLYDIPHQVRGAAEAVANSGADMMTMHASGGVPMMKAAQEGVEAASSANGTAVPVTLGVTVLTSMDDETLQGLGVNRTAAEQVEALAGKTKEAGISGVVASPQEAARLREILGPDAYIVTPGVRPLWAAKGDQSRVATPQKAFESGASHIVVGRPITQADDPVEAFKRIVKEIEG